MGRMREDWDTLWEMEEEETTLPFTGEGYIPWGTLQPRPPPIPTPTSAANASFLLGGLTSEDYVVDLGCSDGGWLIMAAEKFGMRGLGIDIIPELVQAAKEKATERNVNHLLEFQLGDFTADVSWKEKPSFVYIYGMPRLFQSQTFVDHLEGMLRTRDVRVVVYYFAIPGWTPVKEDTTFRVYLYTKASLTMT